MELPLGVRATVETPEETLRGYTSSKLADRTTGLSPPGSILSELERAEYFNWCEAFVLLLTKEVYIHSHHEKVIRMRPTKEWLDHTRQLYEFTGLRVHHLASLIEAHQERGFGTPPAAQADQSWLQSQVLAAYGEVEPSIKPKDISLARRRKISVKGCEEFANGCFARAVFTTQATTAASVAIVNLLEYTAEGVTSFRSKIATAFS